MSNLSDIADKLRILASRHSKRYGDKPISSSQLLRKINIAVKAMADITSTPEDTFSNFPDIKKDLDEIHQKLFEIFKFVETNL